MLLRIISFVTQVIMKNDITPFSETRSCHYRPRWTYMPLSTMPLSWLGGSTWVLCSLQKAFQNLPSSQRFINIFLLGTSLACLIKMEKPLSLNNIVSELETKGLLKFCFIRKVESRFFPLAFIFYSFILDEGPVWLALLKWVNRRPNK